jgi:hypothetical protein
MTSLTIEAEKIRTDYLEQVRRYVGKSKTVDADEILRDVAEHIDRELQELSQPVSRPDLEAILNRLGSPRQWLNEEDLPWLQKIALRFRRGPEDWRLAYLAFGTLVIGSIVTGPFGLLAGFCLSRAALNVTEKDELQTKKWLIYPSLVIVYFLMAACILFWPVYPLLACGIIALGTFYKTSVLIIGCGTASILTVGMALWWGGLWYFNRSRPNTVKTIFRPFADHWTLAWLGRASFILFFIGLIAVVICILELND